MIANLATAPIEFRVQREPATRTISFVQNPVIIDRDYVIAAPVKLTGLVAATAVTLLTVAVFLFM